ncbi:hypothetical protein [Methylobacterium radiodurans]|uniref:Uncharacterized protein n=1 Tax=Methylobacterium radiodurans TaxID=2202828 RepID=A0A2U8VQC4_9HYPH|nr:hypothetical protein [Methylobacterium radiodurans]AWN35939.1 hypothetical protein DK427_09500 [Methylobacterium radiodurans]
MTKLFIARLTGPGGDRPLITVRAAAEGEARLFLEAAYPEDVIADVAEPGEWISDSDTGAKTGDVREHPGVTWQPPSSLAG